MCTDERNADLSFSVCEICVATPLTKEEMDHFMSPYDLKRLEAYAHSMVDYHTITDLVPPIARYYFQRRIAVSLSPAQSAILLGVGLQLRTLDEVAVRVSSLVNIFCLRRGFPK